MLTDSKRHTFNWIDQNRQNLSDWHQIIWHLAEPAWREYKSCAWYVKKLREEGFEVEEGSGGMPTAFMATWRNGDGPTIGAYAEYDAVPGNCQAATTNQTPRSGLSRFAPGHTDPHSALGMGSLGAILAAKQIMQHADIRGTLIYFGEPAEKVQGSKPVHALKGYYDGLEAMISYHPFYMLPLCNTTRWDTHCGSYYNRIYTFTCESPESWLSSADDSPIAASHSAARAPGANSALFLMYSMTKTTQESMLPHTGGWSMNEAIMGTGQATADNLPTRIAQIQYAWRTPNIEMADQILQVLDQNADHAASVSHCEVAKGWVARSRPGLANHALAELTYRNLQLAGAPKYNARAVNLAREIQQNLGFEPMQKPFLEACEKLISPQDAEKKLRKDMPGWQKNWTSDDYVEMSWHTPTVRLYVARPMLKLPEQSAGYPDWVANALGGMRDCIDPTIMTAAKTIAATIIDLLTDTEAIKKIRKEFIERTGGGIGGDKWIPPLLPEDFEAPIHYPWPEYFMTLRGEDWLIPNCEDY